VKSLTLVSAGLAILLGTSFAVSANTSAANAPITFIGAGDIAETVSGAEATAKLLDQAVAADPNTVVWTSGDNAYPNGSASDFNTFYQPTWGRHRLRTKPVPGNHEYQTANAAGYFNYFCPTTTDCVFPGGTQPKYYSYDVGNWHILGLNSEVEFAAGSPQMSWIQQDLAANQGKCLAAIFHKPRFDSSVSGGVDPNFRALWDVLYAGHTDLILNGHSHVYERFAKQTPAGVRDDTTGIRQFIVGTGGASEDAPSTPKGNSEVVRGNVAGVAKFTLTDAGYSWQFMPVAGQTFTDSGSDSCHNSTGDALPTVSVTAPANGATVQGGSVTLSANASDNDSVAGVQFKVDGVDVGAEVTAAPYGVTWDTTGASEGQHTITAVARDSANQTTTSSSVYVTVDNVPDTSVTVERRVSASSDDAEQNSNAGPILDSTDLELVTDTSVQTVGMRFTGVNVPRGATITNAYVQFAVDEAGSTATSLNVRGEAADNAATFTTSKNNLSNRPRTTASASWSPPAWSVLNEAGVNQRTSDLKAVVQEITSRNGWNSGNALNIIVTGSGQRNAHAYDGQPTMAPLLHVEYAINPNAPQTLTFAPGADATIKQSSNNSNFGTSSILESDSSPVEDFLLKFNVEIPAGKTVTSAKLRLYNVDASPAGGRFFIAANNSWTETAVTWNNAPATTSSTPFASLGAVAANNWYEVNLPNITASNTYSYRVKNSNSDNADYRSKEGSAANAAQLVVEVQ
jgi:hypothetical protein